jgi:hypothetical protein
MGFETHNLRDERGNENLKSVKRPAKINPGQKLNLDAGKPDKEVLENQGI